MPAKECGAKRRNREERCKAPAMENGKCRIHGGATLRGFASPHFISGKHSKYLSHLPAGVQGAFESNVSQNENVSLKENMALADIHLQELLALLDDGSLVEYFQSIKENVRLLQEVVLNPPERGKNGEEIPRLSPEFYFSQLTTLFSLISSKTQLYNQIEKANDHIRKLAESQSKIEAANLDAAIKTNNYLPSQFVWEFITSLADVLRMSPPEIRQRQLKMLQEKHDIVPKNPAIPADTPEMDEKRHAVTLSGGGR